MHSPAAAREREATAAARSQFEDPVAGLSPFGADTAAALSLCAAGATAIAAMVSVRRQWARLRSAQLRLGRTTAAAAAATTHTATGSARTDTIRTERRDAVGLWCSKPMVKS